MDTTASVVVGKDAQGRQEAGQADTTVGYDQSERSFHKDPAFVLMAATAR